MSPARHTLSRPRARRVRVGAAVAASVALTLGLLATPFGAVAAPEPESTATPAPAPEPSATAEPSTPAPEPSASPDAPAPEPTPSSAPAPPATEPPTTDAPVTEAPEAGTPDGGRGDVAAPLDTAPLDTEPPRVFSRMLADIGILAAGVPEPPAEVYAETFEQGLNSTTPSALAAYASGRYTASSGWSVGTNCTGVLVNYSATYPNTSFCPTQPLLIVGQSSLSARDVRRMADVLGQVAAGTVGTTNASSPANGSTAATRTNHALTADPYATITGGTTVLQSGAGIGVAASGLRYYQLRFDAVGAQCGTNNASLSYNLATAAGGVLAAGFSSPVVPCAATGSVYYTSPTLATLPTLGGIVDPAWGSSVRAATFTGNTATLLTPAQIAAARLQVVNSVTGTGSAFGVDNLRVLDVTPRLDTAFSSTSAVAGVPSTLTFTVTNTSDLLAKSDWSFTTALPAGLVVAPTPAVGGTCANVTGAAFAVTAAAGGAAVSAAGGDLATGATSCTVTVDVVAAAPGTYTVAAGASSGAVIPANSSTLTVEAATRITIQKNVTARFAPTDQFRLALSSGATEVAAATTTGTSTGLQAQAVGPVTVTRGATYLISETVVSGSSLNTYDTSYQCVRGTTTIATGTSVSGPITIPDEAGVDIVCTFTNAAQAAGLYCDGTYFYAVRANGSIVQVNASSTTAPPQITGAVAGGVDVNALGVYGDGSGLIALDRGADAGNAAAVVSYTVTAAGGVQSSRTALTTAQGALLNRAGTALDGTVIAGAVDPLNGRFVIGKSATGSVRLWEYTPAALNNGSRFLYLGSVSTGTSAGENGDIAFDAQGNLHIVQTAADSSNVGMFSVTRENLLAASGGTLPASTTVRRALSGTDAGFALTSVNGMAFSPTGSVYLGNSTTAYQFDPTTWARIPGSPRTTIGTTASGAGATDLASCSSPSTITVEKNVVGRVAASDQFRLALSSGSPAVEGSVATTTGSATGLQGQRIGPVPAQINTAVTIAETMAAGSSSPLTAYTSVYECWADGVRFASGTDKSATISIPNRLSVGVACTFTNSPAPFATVRVTKIVEDAAGANRTPAAGWTMTSTATANAGSTVTLLPSRNPAQQTGADGTATWQMLFGAASHRGRVVVAETSQSGYRYQSLVCTVNGSTTATTVTTVGDQVRGAVNVDIAPGGTVDCVFSNRPVATLTLVKNVAFGSAPASAWQLAATRSIPTALAGPAGAGGSAALAAVTVSADTAYRLSETGGSATYVQVGTWVCATAGGVAVPVTAAGDVTLTRGTSVTCTVTNATASLTLLKNVQNPSPGFQPSTWNLTATPATLAGLAPTTVAGADYTTIGNGNLASTFEVRPGHTYTLSEALAQSGTRLAFRQLRLEQRQSNGTWTPVTSATITAPAAGQNAIYRFVNAPVNPTVLPLTGGASTDAFLIGGSAVLILAFVLAVWHGRRRTRRSGP